MIALTCGSEVGAPVYVSENLCAYQFAWNSIHACPTVIPPSPLTLAHLVAEMALGKTARLVYNLKICTGTDGMGGMTLGSFEYFGPGVVGNELAFLGYDESNIIKNEAASTKFVHRIVSTKIYENQMVEIVSNDIDLANYKVVSNSSISCAYGLPTDGATFTTGFF